MSTTAKLGIEIEIALISALIRLKPTKCAWQWQSFGGGQYAYGFGKPPHGGVWCRFCVVYRDGQWKFCGREKADTGFIPFAELLSRLRDPAFRKLHGLTPFKVR